MYGPYGYLLGHNSVGFTQDPHLVFWAVKHNQTQCPSGHKASNEPFSFCPLEASMFARARICIVLVVLTCRLACTLSQWTSRLEDIAMTLRWHCHDIAMVSSIHRKFISEVQQLMVSPGVPRFCHFYELPRNLVEGKLVCPTVKRTTSMAMCCSTLVPWLQVLSWNQRSVAVLWSTESCRHQGTVLDAFQSMTETAGNKVDPCGSRDLFWMTETIGDGSKPIL